MESYDLRGAVLSALAGARFKLNRKAKPNTFCCPRHEDKTPSAWIGDNAWGCHACGFTESLTSLAGELGVAIPERKARGLTVKDYAERKGFSEVNLAKWGVRDGTGKFGDPVVVIPYLAADGTLLREKHRTHKGTFWAGEKGATFLYGLNILAQQPADAPLLLVEGESDCHAAWHKGVLAVGVPGATGWKSEWRALIGARPVYAWQEPDTAGATFVAKLAADFPDVRVIAAEPGGAKDLAELFKATGAGFKKALEARMAAALPANRRAPEVPFDAILGGVLDAIKRDKLAPIDAVPTPFPSWNTACRGAGGGVGLARGWHVTLAGNTGQGKSLVALNLGARAVEAGENVAFVSLEMTQNELATRILAIISGESVRSLEQGREFDEYTFDRASRAITEIHERTGGTLYVNRDSVSDLAKIEAAIRYEHEHHGCRFIIVDYMQLAAVKNARNEIDRITEVSHTIRRLAAELKIVTIGLSQYNRETSKDKDRAPSPQGLHGGSALENDSHQVLLLDHTSYARDDLTNSATTKLLLAKNRHGPQSMMELRYNYRDLSVSETGSITKRRIPKPERLPTDHGEAWEAEQPADLSFPTDEAEELPDAA